MKVVLKHAGKWLHFQNPEKILVADEIEKVLPMLAEAEASGLFAAGFVSYEAAHAFDSALTTNSSDGFPLLCIGLFRAPDVLEDIEEAPTSSFEVGKLKPSVSKTAFAAAIDEIKERIAEGATYQVNYTYRLVAGFSGDPWAFFYELVKAQKTEYAAFIDAGDYVICSASPELFFSFNEGRIVSRPMKGTARRGRTFVEDRRQAEALRTSGKDRAENIMIVDMIRNDIGRVAEPGSVETVSTYDIEKYPTLWQMTSTVRGDLSQRRKDAKTGAGNDFASLRLCGIFRALFPCASITGAPKAKTMEIIRELETSPRRIYTGTIGFISPRGEACFNVAIRTALIDTTTGKLEYGVGGGIVWDSEADAEYQETLTKARIISEPRPDFQLLETMLWEPEGGIFLLEDHMQRLGRSAAYFDIPLDQYEVLQGLEELSHTLKGVRMRIRLLVSPHGSFEMEALPVAPCSNASPPERGKAFRVNEGCYPPAGRGNDAAPLCVKLALEPIDSQNVFLFHKTTNREVYEKAVAGFPDADDVILWNERGEVTEATIYNVVIRKEGRLITPPVECGLLAGTFREYLLKSGQIEEGIVTVDDLKAAPEIYLINSVRKWQHAQLG